VQFDRDIAACPASTIFPGQRQLFFPIDDNYKLGKTALLPYTGADRGRR
jgi:hypothetical protein